MSEKMITCIYIPARGRCTCMCIKYEEFNRKACEAIGCSTYDFPRIAMSGDYHLLVDDEGLLRDKPLNPIASVLYSPTGQGIIVGDALLCAVGINEDGEPDIADIPIGDDVILTSLLNSMIEED